MLHPGPVKRAWWLISSRAQEWRWSGAVERCRGEYVSVGVGHCCGAALMDREAGLAASALISALLSGRNLVDRPSANGVYVSPAPKSKSGGHTP